MLRCAARALVVLIVAISAVTIAPVPALADEPPPSAAESPMDTGPAEPAPGSVAVVEVDPTAMRSEPAHSVESESIEAQASPASQAEAGKGQAAPLPADAPHVRTTATVVEPVGGEVAPPFFVDGKPRLSPGFAAMPDGRSAVLYGGGLPYGAELSPYADTWVWNGAGWEPKCGTSIPGATTPCPPGHRAFPAMATVPQGALLYGGLGENTAGLAMDPKADMWLWTGSEWTLLCAACPPGNRFAAAMAGNGTQVLLFGGFSGNLDDVAALGDTWLWNGTAWSLLHPGGEGAPAPRGGASLVWDGSRWVLFGGGRIVGQYDPPAVAGDTWYWDGNAWALLCVTCGPAPRMLASFNYLTGLGGPAALLSGGIGPGQRNPTPPERNVALWLTAGSGTFFPSDESGGVSFGDLWLWNGARWTKLQSPWPDTAAVEGAALKVTGMPLLNVAAASPDTCGVTLVGAVYDPSSGGAPFQTRTYRVGLDQPCPAAVPVSTRTPINGVAVDASAPMAADAGALPVTGVGTDAVSLAALALVAVGTAFTYAARKRRRRLAL
jgi:LPXTG-motif cell wall-anchored protein